MNRATLRQHVLYATFAGLALGAVALLATRLQTGSMDPTEALSNVGLALFNAYVLLVALVLASRVRPRRTAPWWPYVVAAFCASSIMIAVEIGLAGPVMSNQDQADLPTLVKVWRVFPQTLVITLLIALGYMRGRAALRRTAALRDMQLSDVRLSRVAAESRLKVLQARVDPQFLFDTLAAIELTYAADGRRGEQMIDHLIVYLRAALPSLDSPTSTLDAECSLARAWLAITLARQGGRFTHAVLMPTPLPTASMPPMVLQPLVQHAAAALFDGAVEAPHIAIDTTLDQGRLRTCVTTTGAAFAPEADTPLLATLRERVATIYGDSATLLFRWLDTRSSQALLDIPHEEPNRNPG